MTPSFQGLFYYLWIAPRVLQVLLLAVLIKRNLHPRFPIFTGYTIFSLCNFCALFFLSPASLAAYFKWYSSVLVINTALRFGIVHELFSHVFASRSSLYRIEKRLFRWTTMLMLCVSIAFAAFTTASDVASTWFDVHVLERSGHIVLWGLILYLFMLSSYLHLTWDRLDFGIAVGFGILSSMGLALDAIRSQIGLASHLTLDLLDMASYHCCVLIWLFYLLSPERKREPAPDAIPHTDLEVWNRELDQLLQQ